MMNTTKTLQYSRLLNTMLSFIGLMLSLYAVYVEAKLENDKDYTALCDINEIMSCSKVFSTKYAKGFGLVGPVLGEDHILNVPNGIYGVVSYIIMLALSQLKMSGAAHAQLLLVVLCNCMTPYLAYLLYQVIGTVCVLCVSTYAVNAALLLVGVWRRAALVDVQRRKAKKGMKKE